MKTLNADLKSGAYRPVYCLYGEEAFLKRSYKNRFRQLLVGDNEMNLHLFEGADVDVQAVMDAADTMPFFAEKRLIIVENSGLFKRDAGKLPDYLSRMPESSCLLFVETAVDKRARLYKKVNELGYLAELGRQPERELARWAGNILKAEGRRISERTMEQLLAMTGNDMERIRTELDKLLAYTEGRSVVTPEDVEAICSRQLEGRIFDLVRAIASGKRSEALLLYADLLALRESPAGILYLITRQFLQLLQLKELEERGAGAGEMARELGLGSYVIGKLRQQAREYDRGELIDCVRECVATEERIKSGKAADRLAVEMLLVWISGREWGEES